MDICGVAASLTARMWKLANPAPAVSAHDAFFARRHKAIAHDAADWQDQVERGVVRALDYPVAASLRPVARSSALHITPASGF